MGKLANFDRTKFAQRFHQLRMEHTYTMEQFIKILKQKYNYNVSKGMISKYEKGTHEPNMYFIDVSADLFGVSESYLMGRVNNKSRDNKKECEVIPMLGTIAAGVPILAQEDITGEECAMTGEHVHFCLRVKGDSMIGARIFDGDIVFIRQQPSVENGEIAAVLIGNEEATLKRIYKEHGAIVLRAENPKYPETRITKKDGITVSILGKAICFKGAIQ